MTRSKEPSGLERWRSLVVVLSVLATIAVYLFVNAPPPLAAPTPEHRTVPMREVFSVLEATNDAAREMWTNEIVHRGSAVGLVFDERWRAEAVHAGPLPALFLRESARHLERSRLPLRLFLGSEYPINAANQFTGQQAQEFATLVATGAPQFFLEPTTRLHTAMFPDRALAAACVSCHNEHPDSPKTDWQPDAIMGATTWMYPDELVTAGRALELIAALRASIREAYASYLDEVAAFPHRPGIGERWPKDGFYLPSEEVFARELDRRISLGALRGILEPGTGDPVPEPLRDPPVVLAAAPAVTEPRPPMLVIRAARSVKVTIDRDGDRLLVARLPAGGGTALGARPPLRLRLSDPRGVEIEYDGKQIDLATTPEPGKDDDFEVTIGVVPGRS